MAIHPLTLPTIFILSLAPLHAEGLDDLAPTLQAVQQHKQSEIDTAYDKLKYDWLSPLSLSATWQQNHSAATDTDSTTSSLALTLSQDIFRSGGIYYAIQYANSKYAYDQTALGQENAALQLELVTAVLNLRLAEAQLAQSDHRLKSREIELLIKRRQYEAGDVDITQLNNAIMDRNSEQKTQLGLKTSLHNAKIALKRLSDRDPEQISLPTFTLTDKASYLNQSYTVAALRRQAQMQNDQYRLTRAAYLPALALNAQYAQTDYRSDLAAAEYNGNNYYVGLQLSLPLDFTTSATLENTKATALKVQAQTLDKQREEDAAYEEAQTRIATYRDYIDLTKSNLALYDELINAAEAGVKAGYRPGYDVETLRHTKAVDEYEITINELNIQLELAKLHYQTSTRSPLTN